MVRPTAHLPSSRRRRIEAGKRADLSGVSDPGFNGGGAIGFDGGAAIVVLDLPGQA